MQQINIPNHHPLYYSYQFMKEMLSILPERSNIDHFNFTKLCANGNLLTLSTTPDWQKYFFENTFDSENYPIIQEEKTHVVLLDSLFPDIAKTAREHSGMYNMISIIHRTSEYHYVFGFASSKFSYDTLNFYIQDLDALKNFCFYFLDKGQYLLKKAETDYLKWKCEKISDKYINNFVANEESLNKLNFDIRKKYKGKTITLSISELNCLKYICQGFSSKMIANVRNTSYRTVENQIYNIKKKIGCNYKSQLIEFYSSYLNQTLEVDI